MDSESPEVESPEVDSESPEVESPEVDSESPESPHLGRLLELRELQILANPHVKRLRELEILWRRVALAKSPRSQLFALSDDEQAEIDDPDEEKYGDRFEEAVRTADKIEVAEDIVVHHRDWRAQRLLQDVAILRAHHLGVRKEAIIDAASMSRTALYDRLPRTQKFIEKLRTSAEFVLTDLGAVLVCKNPVCKECPAKFAVGAPMEERPQDEAMIEKECPAKFAVGAPMEERPQDEAMIEMASHWRDAHAWVPRMNNPPTMSAGFDLAKNGRILACRMCDAYTEVGGHIHTGTYPAMYDHWQNNGWLPSAVGTPKPSGEYRFELGVVDRGDVGSLLLQDLTARPESAARDKVKSLLSAFPEAFDTESEALLAETAASADRQHKELTDELLANKVNSQNAPSTLAAIAYHAQEERKQKLLRDTAILEAQSLGLPATKIARLLGVKATSVRRWRSAARAFDEKLEEDAEIHNTTSTPNLVCKICDWATEIDPEETEAYPELNENEHWWWTTEIDPEETEAYTQLNEHWWTAHDWRPDRRG